MKRKNKPSYIWEDMDTNKKMILQLAPNPGDETKPHVLTLPGIGKSFVKFVGVSAQ